MSNWRRNAPQRCDYDTEEEYNDALEAYDAAIDEDIEDYFLRRNEE